MISHMSTWECLEGQLVSNLDKLNRTGISVDPVKLSCFCLTVFPNLNFHGHLLKIKTMFKTMLSLPCPPFIQT